MHARPPDQQQEQDGRVGHACKAARPATGGWVMHASRPTNNRTVGHACKAARPAHLEVRKQDAPQHARQVAHKEQEHSR